MSANFWTYKEAFDYASDRIQQYNTKGAPGRRVRLAILNAYRDLSHRYDWRYYNRLGAMQLQAPQSTGTIEYTASTRTVTLTGATFPTDADLWRIKISDQYYGIESRPTTTTIVLRAEDAPLSDIASGTAFEIFKDNYRLPSNFREMQAVWDEDTIRELRFIDFSQQEGMYVRYYHESSDPWGYSIEYHPNYPGVKMLRVVPYASTARSLRYVYSASPMNLFTAIPTGKASLDAVDKTKLTLDQTLSDNFVDGVIWISSSKEIPTSEIGGYNQKLQAETNNPFTQVGIIKSISGTTVYVRESLSDFTNVGYLVTSLIDIDKDTMLSLFQAMIDLELAKLMQQVKIIPDLERESALWLRKTIEAERRISKSTTDFFQKYYNPSRLDGPIVGY